VTSFLKTPRVKRTDGVVERRPNQKLHETYRLCKPYQLISASSWPLLNNISKLTMRQNVSQSIIVYEYQARKILLTTFCEGYIFGINRMKPDLLWERSRYCTWPYLKRQLRQLRFHCV